MTTTVTGQLVITPGAKFASSVLDPPEREGYVNEIVRMTWTQEAAAAEACIVGCSVKIPDRAVYSDSDIFAVDILTSAIPNQYNYAADSDGAASYAVETGLFFQDRVQVIVATRDGAAVAGNGIIINWAMDYDQRKLTDKIRDDINRRCYS